jgi:hypothetical protein
VFVYTAAAAAAGSFGSWVLKNASTTPSGFRMRTIWLATAAAECLSR